MDDNTHTIVMVIEVLLILITFWGPFEGIFPWPAAPLNA
jgi:hypothetical protein